MSAADLHLIQKPAAFFLFYNTRIPAFLRNAVPTFCGMQFDIFPQNRYTYFTTDVRFWRDYANEETAADF